VARPDRAKGEYSYRLPHALPGGQALLFTSTTTNQLADAKIVLLSLATGQQAVLTDGADARYVPTGHLVFARQGALLAAPFDVTALRLTGDAVGLVDDVMQAFNAATAPLRTGAAQFDVSPTGSLAYAPGGIFSEDIRPLVWVDRTGTVTPLALPPRVYYGPRLAPDGQRLAFYTYEGAGGRAWITDLRSGTSTPITETGALYYPVWSPDGVRVAYGASGSLFWRRADGVGGPERLTTSSNEQMPSAWSPDGKTLAVVERTATSEDILMLPIGEGTAPPRPWLNSRFNEAHPDWSPDGRWIAYDSNESGRSEVYVQPYPGPGARYAVSRDGGSTPVWARDGRELFYLASGPNGQVTMMTAPITTTSTFSTGTPTRLFDGRFMATLGSRAYDVAADGRRFIMVQPVEQPPLPVAQIVIVQNWVEELKRLVPTK
jgi:serine/threonine-protein kinase